MDYPTTLVLGPGGVKGFLLLGALKYLNDNNHLRELKRLVGVSIGAIVSLFIVCGLDINEMLVTALEVPNLFSEYSNIDNIKSLLDVLDRSKQHLGLISNAPIKDCLEAVVIKKFGFVPTLNQLYQATGMELVSIAHNLTLDKCENISYLNNPDISCIEAVLLSINIPGIFYKMKYNGNIYIDGAFGNSYPVNIYDNDEENILGLYISTKHEDIDNSIYSYFSKIITCTMSQMAEMIRRNSSRKCTNIKLETTVKNTMGVGLNRQQKLMMFNDGYETVKRFFRDDSESSISSPNNDYDIPIVNDFKY